MKLKNKHPLPSWWAATANYNFLKSVPGKKSKNIIGTYIQIHGKNDKGKPFSQRVQPGTYNILGKKQKKKYLIPHVWPEKYKEYEKNQKKS